MMKAKLRGRAIPGLWLVFIVLIQLVLVFIYGEKAWKEGWAVSIVWGGIFSAFAYNWIYAEKRLSYALDLVRNYIVIYSDSAPIPLTCNGKTVIFEVVGGEKPHLFIYDLGLNGSQQHADGINVKTANMDGGYFYIDLFKGERKGYQVEWKDGSIWTVAKKLVWRSA